MRNQPLHILRTLTAQISVRQQRDAAAVRRLSWPSGSINKKNTYLSIYLQCRKGKANCVARFIDTRIGDMRTFEGPFLDGVDQLSTTWHTNYYWYKHDNLILTCQRRCFVR